VESLEDGLDGHLWNWIFSRCPFLGITKNIFFNKFVIEKGNYIKSGWFYWYFNSILGTSQLHRSLGKYFNIMTVLVVPY